MHSRFLTIWLYVKNGAGGCRNFKSVSLGFLAFSYYRTTVFDRFSANTTTTGGQQGAPNPYLQTTAWGWPIDPDGLR